MNRDMYNNAIEKQSIQIQNSTAATVNGAAVDLKGFDSACINGQLGAAGAATMKVQESVDGSTGWTDAVADDILGTQGVAMVLGTPVALGYVGNLRYIRAVIIVTTTADIVASVVLGHAQSATVR